MGKGQHAPCAISAPIFISYKENTTMAIQNKLVDIKLQIRVEGHFYGRNKDEESELHTHQVRGDK